jgi:heat shock protein HslJ
MKKRLNRMLIIFLLAGLGVFAACNGTGETPAESTPAEGIPSQPGTAEQTKTLFVGPEMVDCSGAAPQQCMLVKENRPDEYTLFYQQIEGFTFEPGYEYELLVQVITVDNPPADGSALRYSLVNMVNRTPAAEVQPAESEASADGTPLVGTLWQMERFEGDDALGSTEVTAVFAEDGTLSGNAGCNSFSTSYTLEGDNLRISDTIIATMMACLDDGVMEQEAAFLGGLPGAANYKIEGRQLTLYDEAGRKIGRFTAVQAASLTGTSWQLTGYNNGQGAVVSVTAGVEATAVFAEDGTLSGSAGCNRYSTSFAAEAGALSIGPIVSTMMACADEVMRQETAFLAALDSATAYTIEGEQLALRDSDGSLLATFKAMTPLSLSGINWQLNDLIVNNEVVAVAETPATAFFGEDGHLSGTTGCNNYRTTFSLDGRVIRISPEISSTRRACLSEELSAQESAYLVALPQATAYDIQEGRLELRNAAGELLAAYSLAAISDLPGSHWLVTGYNDGLAVTSPIVGSEITLTFDESGNIEGGASCNRYFGPYQSGDSSLTIGPLVTTRALCNEPEGIMQQEAQFLAILQSVATYSFQGNLLEIRTAADTIALQAIALP